MGRKAPCLALPVSDGSETIVDVEVFVFGAAELVFVAAGSLAAHSIATFFNVASSPSILLYSFLAIQHQREVELNTIEFFSLHCEPVFVTTYDDSTGARARRVELAIDASSMIRNVFYVVRRELMAGSAAVILKNYSCGSEATCQIEGRMNIEGRGSTRAAAGCEGRPAVIGLEEIRRYTTDLDEVFEHLGESRECEQRMGPIVFECLVGRSMAFDIQFFLLCNACLT